MSDHPELDPRLAAALRAGCSLPIPGFADRAVAAVRRDRARRRAIRWASWGLPLAACLALALAPLRSTPEADLERLATLVGELEVGVPHLEDCEGLARLAVSGN
jgi:hypothetical protein